MIKAGISLIAVMVIALVIAGMGIGKLANNTRTMANSQSNWTQYTK